MKRYTLSVLMMCLSMLAWAGRMGDEILDPGHPVNPGSYNVTVTTDASMGSVTGGGMYVQGTDATIEAEPNDGYEFVQWSNSVTDNPYTFTVSSDVSLTAEFAVIQCLLASGTCGAAGDNISWELSCDSVLTISGTGAMADYDAENNAPWYWDYHDAIKSIVIADGVTSIGNYAFFAIDSVVSVSIPNSVTTIGEGAFYVCRSLPSIDISSHVTSIGPKAWIDCQQLTAINVAEDNPIFSSIDGVLFNKAQTTLFVCPTAKEGNYTIPNGVATIAEYAFSGCSLLSSINIPNTVTKIESSAFMACDGLTSLLIPNSVVSIESYAFAYNDGLTSVTLPIDLTEISQGLFQKSSNLVTITIPNSVTAIGEFAFYECQNLTSVNIPAGVTSIEDGAFGRTGLTSIDIPDGVTGIGEWAFIYCEKLKTVTISKNVNFIGWYAFSDCTALTSITCKALTPPECGEDAFDNVKKSTPVYVPCSSVSAYKAAAWWKKFTKIQGDVNLVATYSVSSSNEEQGTAAITKEPTCSDMTLSFAATPNEGYSFVQWSDGVSYNPRSITLTKDTTLVAEFELAQGSCNIASGSCGTAGVNIIWHLSCDGVLSFSGSGAMADFEYGETPWEDYKDDVVEVIVGEGITTIGEVAFINCRNLATVSLPSTLTKIGGQAFEYCESLTGIDIPDNVTVIDYYAFAWSGLESIVIPDGVTDIESFCFYDCKSLASVTLGSGVETIWNNAFENCESLTDIEIPNTVTAMYDNAFTRSGLTSIVIPNSLAEIPDGAFDCCRSLTSVVIPSSVKTIGGSAFFLCDELISLTLSEGLETIEWSAFMYCTKLQTLEIPSTVTTIENYAFYDCEALTSITSRATTPQEIDEAVFDEINKSTCVLNVPCAAIDDYSDADNWSDFTHIQAIDNLSVTYSITSADDEKGEVTVTDEQVYCDHTEVTVQADAADGYEFTQWSDGNTDNPRTLTVTQDTTLTATFDVHYLRPTVSIDSVTNRNDDETTTTVLYSSTDATTFKYYIVGETSLSSATVASASGSFVLDISSLGAGTYTLKMVANSECCVSDTVSKDFIIYRAVEVSGEVDASTLGLDENSDVEVTPSGCLTFKTPTEVHSVVLRYGDLARAQLSGISNVIAEVVEVVYDFPEPDVPIASRWFAFAVPFEVRVATGIFMDNQDTPARYGYDYVLEEFDGNQRAITQRGWKRLTAEAVLRPGRMYMIAMPVYASWRFRAADPSELSEAEEVGVDSNPSAIGAHHSGWNGIANTLFTNSTASYGGLVFITTYNNSLGVYVTELLSEHVFLPGVPFFVQVVSAGSFSFTDSHLSSAPQRRAKAEASALSTLSLTNAAGTYTDKAYISYNADKEDAYLIGHDLQKMSVSSPSVQQLWIEAYNMQLSAYEMPLGTEARTVPVGMYAPAAGNYTLSIKGVPSDIFVYLMKNGQPVADIAHSPYTVNLAKGNNNGYSLYAWRIHDIVMPEENATVCQYEDLVWNGQAVETGTPGAYEIRDTLTSSLFPYPDSIHVLKLTVHPKPVIVLNEVAAQCYPATMFNVAYTAQDAAMLRYELLNSSNVPVISTTDVPATAAGTLVLNTTALAAGTYTLHVKAYSAHECESEEAVTTIIIHTTPAISVQPIENTYLGETSIQVTYTTANAATVSYYIQGVTSASAPMEAGSTFTLDISALPAGTYTLCMTAYNDPCQSDVASQTFTIYQLAEVTAEQDASTLGLGEASIVVVGPQGHLSVPSPTHIHSLELQYSEQGHAELSGIHNLTADVAEMVLDLPEPYVQAADRWFAFGVPFEVSVTTGIRKNGQSAPAQYNTDFVIEEFDGQQRATTQAGWRRLEADATLLPGRMYMIAMPEHTSWRFTADDPSGMNEVQQVSVGGYPSAAGDHHAGWNGIANPLYTSATADDNGLLFATTYNNYFGVYMVQLLGDMVFDAAMPFFVQVSGDGTFDFSAHQPSSAAARQPSRQESSVCTLLLTNEAATYTDKAFVAFVADKQDNYCIGHDLPKIQSTSAAVQQLWIEAYDRQLSAFEMPSDEETRTLPLGMYAPAAGNYTLAVADLPAEVSVCLTKDGVPVWNLNESGYTVNLSSGANSGYALYVQRVPKVGTSLTPADATPGVQKVIINDHLWIIRDGKTYDATGVQVK